MKRGFFLIDKHVWERVIELGLNASIAYLVLACGTAKDNRTTQWSVNAIRNYTSIGLPAAAKAVKDLIALGAVCRVQGGARPRYHLEPLACLAEGRKSSPAREARSLLEPSWVWLPNTLVTGAAGERSPLERIRALQEVRALHLCVALYDNQDLADSSGLHWRQIRKRYSRKRITERGKWVLWSFREDGPQVLPTHSAWGPLFEKKSHSKGSRDATHEFWNAWDSLLRLGLLECVPHAIEADTEEAVVIFPCPSAKDEGTQEERALGEAAQGAAFAMLENCMPHHLNTDELIIPVPDAYPKVELVGIYRLRYRPHTPNTAAWYAKLNESLRRWKAEFEAS